MKKFKYKFTVKFEQHFGFVILNVSRFSAIRPVLDKESRLEIECL